MTKYKLDIFKLLKELDKNNYNYFDNLSNEELKEFIPFTLLKWMSSSNKSQLQYLVKYHRINQNFHHITDKKFVYNLLCSVSSEKYNTHTWLGNNKKNNDKTYQLFKKHYPNINLNEYNILSKNDLYNIFSSLGYSKENIKKFL